MSISFPSSPANGQSVTSDGHTWTYNSSRGVWELTVNFPSAAANTRFDLENLQWYYDSDFGWESNIAQRIGIVTRDKTQEYTFGAAPIPSVASKAINELLTIHEMDSNFINLKQGLLDLEFETQRTQSVLDHRVDTLETGVNLNNITEFNTVSDALNTLRTRTGMTSDNAAGGLSARYATNSSLVQVINTLTTGVFGSQGVETKAPLNDPHFTGSPESPTQSTNNYSNQIATTAFVRNKIREELNNGEVHFAPKSANTQLLGVSNRYWNQVNFGTGGLIPRESTANIGSASNYVNNIFFGNSILGNPSGTASLGSQTYPINDITIRGDLMPRYSSTDINLGISGREVNNLNIKGKILPSGKDTVDIGEGPTAGTADSTSSLNKIYAKQILPSDTTSTVGSPDRPFKTGFFDEGKFAQNTIFIGTAEVSATNLGGVILPANSALGDEDNVLSELLIGTSLDQKLAKVSSNVPFLVDFTAGGTISTNDPVHLTAQGTVEVVTSSSHLNSFVGISRQNRGLNQTVEVAIHGPVTGITTPFIDEQTVFLNPNGTFSQTNAVDNVKIGVATGVNSIFVFTTGLDTYFLSKLKLNSEDVSVTTSSASSGGSLVYDTATATFTFRPADLSSFATTSYVNSRLDTLVGAAPSALDTLNELADALGDDANFSTTVTNSLATKAPLNSPTLTGTPSAPTASSSTNTTQIASTAFVQSKINATDVQELSNVSITNLQNGQGLVFNSTTGVFENTLDIGSGGGVTFAVDGGTATTAASSLNIFLDGGSA
tara:strand:- start:345 stop:2675 length:2331 start_codon:yes stop_codon:yes gene_type:complete